MRETFTSLQALAQGYVANDSSSMVLTFLQNEINRAKTFIYADMGDYVTQRTSTAVTVNQQQYYHTPVDCSNVEDVTVTIGGIPYSPESVDSQQRWDALNAITVQGTEFPTHFFQRKRDFGLYPVPGEDGDVITYTYQLKDKNMQYSDYATGTVTVTNNSQTLTGNAATNWDASFIGRWFTTTADGFWYPISGFTDNHTLTLETSFEGVTAAGQTYVIGDSPNLPEELHPLLSMRAAAMFYAGFRKEFRAATYWNNYFYTGDPDITATQVKEGEIDPPGGYLAAKANYASRTTDLVVRRGDIQASPFEAFPWDVPTVSGV